MEISSNEMVTVEAAIEWQKLIGDVEILGNKHQKTKETTNSILMIAAVVALNDHGSNKDPIKHIDPMESVMYDYINNLIFYYKWWKKSSLGKINNCIVSIDLDFFCYCYENKGSVGLFLSGSHLTEIEIN